MKNDKKICCKGMMNMYNNKTDRGFYIKLEDLYLIGFRVIETFHEEKFFPILASNTELRNSMLEAGIKNSSFGGEMGIKYCPWCGTYLYEDE